MIQKFVQTKQTIPIDDTDAFIMIFCPFHRMTRYE